MNNKIILSLAVLLIAGAGTFYTGLSNPTVAEAAMCQAADPIAQNVVPTEDVQPTNPTAIENAGTVFEGYTVTVTDQNTPAVRAVGRDWPITQYFFVDEDWNSLGSISGTAMNAMIEKYKTVKGDAPIAGGEWEYWFAEQFNIYRGIDLGTAITPEKSGVPDNTSNKDSSASSMASEAFDLINQERLKAGLNDVDIDTDMMDAAQIRVEELEEKYDHVRPDGTRMSREYRYAEIINRRANTADIAVSSWMDSSGHRDIILGEKYRSAGIGCYEGKDGTVYWCMLFSR